MNSLEPEEKNLLDSVENQEWQSIANMTQAVENYREFAQNHVTRLAESPISITLDPDVAKVFKTSELVNQVLRVIMKKNLAVSLEETES
jgi:predicted DNA binding CopG/RHH family protein